VTETDLAWILIPRQHAIESPVTADGGATRSHEQRCPEMFILVQGIRASESGIRFLN
jgi:hypothetical protein